MVVSLAHGAGGKEMAELLRWLVFDRVEPGLAKIGDGVGLREADDGAAIPMADGRYLIVSTDSYTVHPPVFPGGDIGVLAACGSINDVVMMGGRPIAMLDAIVVREGIEESFLESIFESFVKVLREEGVALLGGDFKVMPRGSLGDIIMATTCLGIAEKPIVDSGLRPGDKIVVTGPLGEHGATIMALQQGLSVDAMGGLRSDVKPLTRLLDLFREYEGRVHAARDPTRGGLAAVLNEWAAATNSLILVDSSRIPVRPPVRSYSEMMGIDPLYLASEGVAVLAVEGGVAEEFSEDLRRAGYNPEIVGEVREGGEYGGLVVMKTEVGGHRILEPPMGVIVPRIC